MDWKPLTLSAKATIRDALQNIESNQAKLILVVDSTNRLLGTITDGDIRRATLQGASLDTHLNKVINNTPITVDASVGAEQALELMIKEDITHIPAINHSREILWLWSRKEMESTYSLPNAVIIMAGGLGTRLGALTQDTPKPMLSIAGRPILELLLENFINVGFRHFYIAINYKGAQIKKYFGNGELLGCQIEYLQENERLGTAGALSLLPPQDLPFIVTNADLLTRLNLRCLLTHHIITGAYATMLGKEFHFKVPYGVIESNTNGQLLNIQEKPELQYLVAAGMYVLSPETPSYIPQQQFFDMPDLLTKLVQEQKTVSVMSSTSYWLDVGHPADLELAKRTYN